MSKQNIQNHLSLYYEVQAEASILEATYLGVWQ